MVKNGIKFQLPSSLFEWRTCADCLEKALGGAWKKGVWKVGADGKDHWSQEDSSTSCGKTLKEV